MTAYRVYCFNDDGRIKLADWVDGSDDEDAIRQAREFTESYVWAAIFWMIGWIPGIPLILFAMRMVGFR